MSLIFALILQYSAQYGMDPKLVSAVIEKESSFEVSAMGAHGEVGLMQLLPESFPGYSKKQLLDPKTNLRLGVKYLAEMKKNCPHKKEWIICYNTGVGGAKKIKYPEKFPYYKDIQNLITQAQLPGSIDSHL